MTIRVAIAVAMAGLLTLGISLKVFRTISQMLEEAESSEL
jgi:hypothetical protein